MRGTFQIKTSVGPYWIEATCSGYDHVGDYNNPPESHFEIEDISILDDDIDSKEIQFDTLLLAVQSRIESKLEELFFEKLAQFGPDCEA
jgi:hypothetical protein